jgi:hypothetical protein
VQHGGEANPGTKVFWLGGERWLFPGRRLNRPITTRQLSRLFHEAAAAAGITKPVTLHSYHRQLGQPWAMREGRLESEDCGMAWVKSIS